MSQSQPRGADSEHSFLLLHRECFAVAIVRVSDLVPWQVAASRSVQRRCILSFSMERCAGIECEHFRDNGRSPVFKVVLWVYSQASAIMIYASKFMKDAARQCVST